MLAYRGELSDGELLIAEYEGVSVGMARIPNLLTQRRELLETMMRVTIDKHVRIRPSLKVLE